jgi:signal peptidase II
MQNAGREGSALRSPAAWGRYLTVAVIGAALDLLTKWWASVAIEDEATRWPKADIDALGHRLFGLVEFTWQHNRGAVLGVGQGQIPLFVAFTFLALALLTWLFVDSRRTHIWLHLFLGSVVAGALGNLYDRMQFGYVRDFIRFTPQADWARAWGGETGYIYPYVFNIADVFISVGVAGLFLVWLVSVIKQRCAKTAETKTET